jgi:ABC-type amino acid transport system permease subunit
MSAIDMTFAVDFIQAFLVNVSVGFASLLVGLVIGIPFAYVWYAGGFIAGLIGVVVGLLRASPVFVFMFLCLNILTQVIDGGSARASLTPMIALVLALSCYSISVVADTWLDLLKRYGAMTRESIMLAIPVHIRTFVILVMSTSVGAAIGVQEAVMLTLARGDTLSTRQDQIELVSVVLLFFVVFFSAARYLIVLLTRQLNKKSG